MRKKENLVKIAILLLTLIPMLCLCLKGITFFTSLEGKEVAISIGSFAKQIESGELSNEQISSRLKKIAEGELKISKGAGLLKLSLYFGLVAVFGIVALQFYLLQWLVKRT